MSSTSDWMSPLRRAETNLANRLLAMERNLPDDGTTSGDFWREYVATVAAYADVRWQLSLAFRSGAPAATAPSGSRRGR